MQNTEQQVILVTAGSGNIGSRLIPRLLEDPTKPKIIVPTSSSAKFLGRLNSGSRDQIVVEEGDIRDPRWFQSILSKHSVTSVLLCLTGSDELFTTLNIFDAMRKSASVKHLVYISGCGDYSLSTENSGQLQHVGAAHVAVKYILEGKLQYGMPSNNFTHTVLGPSLFFDNDLRSKKSMLEDSFFDEPLGSKGVSRVDPADIALAAHNALKDQGRKYNGQKFMIGSLQTYTNSDIAGLWSKSLGKEIKAAGSDPESLETFEAHVSEFVGPAWGRDMRLMYEQFEARGFAMSEKEYKLQVDLLGKEPEDYVRFVGDTGKLWLGN
ncbi:hypothetical protein EsH8_I_000306 [Colletotrichum jinshuiense]